MTNAVKQGKSCFVAACGCRHKGRIPLLLSLGDGGRMGDAAP